MEIPNQDRVGLTNLFLNPEQGEEWDIVIVNGQILTISGTEYISQKLKQLLLTGYGEVKTDLDYGVKWLDEIIGQKNPNLDAIATTILEFIDNDEVLESLGVVSVKISNMELNKTTRNLTMTLIAKLSDDTTVEIDGVSL